MYVIEDLHTSFRNDYINSDVTTYSFLFENGIIENLKPIKSEITDIDLFQKNKDANGVPYFNLAPDTSLVMHTSGTFISAGSTSSIYVFGENY